MLNLVTAHCLEFVEFMVSLDIPKLFSQYCRHNFFDIVDITPCGMYWWLNMNSTLLIKPISYSFHIRNWTCNISDCLLRKIWTHMFHMLFNWSVHMVTSVVVQLGHIILYDHLQKKCGSKTHQHLVFLIQSPLCCIVTVLVKHSDTKFGCSCISHLYRHCYFSSKLIAITKTGSAYHLWLLTCIYGIVLIIN